MSGDLKNCWDSQEIGLASGKNTGWFLFIFFLFYYSTLLPSSKPSTPSHVRNLILLSEELKEKTTHS